jgi:DNA-binding transcriptional LysR family regulator
MGGIEWDDLRYFLAAARTRSLGAAGKGLGASASTVGRRIAALETSLGARLFSRTRDGLRLSADGERLRPAAERVEAEVARLRAGALADGEAIQGTVRVATTEALGAFLVERGLGSLSREHPSLVVEVLGGNRPVDLARGEADLAVRPLRPTEAGLRIKKLASLGFAVFASTEYVRRRGAPRSPGELAGHDVVLFSAELAGLPEARWLREHPGVRVTFQSNSMPAILAAIRAGAGIGVLTEALGALDPGLEKLFAVEAIPARPLWLVTASDAAERAAVKVVARKIESILRG